jgi:DNA-binding CsgD family transcriptional regulator
MNEVSFLQLSFWLTILSINLLFLWKYYQIKIKKNLNQDKSSTRNVEDFNIKYFDSYINNIDSKRLLNLIDDIKHEDELLKHYKIQKLVSLFYKDKFKIIKKNNKNLTFDEVTKKEFEDFKTKLLYKHANLTEQDLQICELVAKNKRSSEIAKVLNLSEGTVRVYKNKLKTKMNLEPKVNFNFYLKELIEQQ